MSNKKALNEYAEKIKSAHRGAVHSLFKECGLPQKNIDANTLLAGYKLFGEPFLARLFHITNSAKSNYCNLTGTDNQLLLKKAQEQKSSWDKIKSIFNTASGIVESAKTVINVIDKNVVNADKTQEQKELDAARKKADDKRKGNITLYVGCSIAIVLIIILIFK